jgi:hypothetical protein
MMSHYNVFLSHLIYARYDVQYPTLIGLSLRCMLTQNIVERPSLEKTFHTLQKALASQKHLSP